MMIDADRTGSFSVWLSRAIGRRWLGHLLGEVNDGIMEIDAADHREPLLVAYLYSMSKAVEHILGVGFDVNAKSLNGWTATI